MSLNTSDLQVGDLLFYPPNDFIGKGIAIFSSPLRFFRKKACHVSGISKIEDDGTIWIIEAHIESGVVEKVLNPKWFELVTHKRLKFELSGNQKALLIGSMRNEIVGKKYDLGSFFSKFFRDMVLPREEPLLNDRNAFDCAETWAYAYKKYLDVWIAPHYNVHTVNPAALMNADLLVDV